MTFVCVQSEGMRLRIDYLDDMSKSQEYCGNSLVNKLTVDEPSQQRPARQSLQLTFFLRYSSYKPDTTMGPKLQATNCLCILWKYRS